VACIVMWNNHKRALSGPRCSLDRALGVYHFVVKDCPFFPCMNVYAKRAVYILQVVDVVN
jgi:hypothetical protein